MIQAYGENASSSLPSAIRRTLEERRGYHHRFYCTFIVTAFVLLLVLIAVVWSLRNEAVGVQVFLGVLYFIFFGIPAYFIFYHRKQRRVLDECLRKNAWSMISGTLDGIQRLKGKRVRYVIDGHPIEGTLAFLGFRAFQNTRIVEVISQGRLPIQLYLLPGGLIAGGVYPGSDVTEPIRRPVSSEDWEVIANNLSGTLKLYAGVSLVISLLLTATCWFIEWKLGWGWEYLGELLAVFNGALLLLMAGHALVSWPEIRAWLNRHDRGVYVEIYRGTATEWYLTATRYRGNNTITSVFDGWVRLCGGLHHIQHDIAAADRGLLEPLQTPINVEYLVYRGRLSFLRSHQARM
ncbi:hypothetical protein ACFOET_02315 [Parapedobacter deserti]|uniref:Uncharacterized protein n=1 Tax=Parapedobacter deserti TaxID=1912957 RepID=A0ABV7JEA0_9SPHI